MSPGDFLSSSIYKNFPFYNLKTSQQLSINNTHCLFYSKQFKHYVTFQHTLLLMKNSYSRTKQKPRTVYRAETHVKDEDK